MNEPKNVIEVEEVFGFLDRAERICKALKRIGIDEENAPEDYICRCCGAEAESIEDLCHSKDCEYIFALYLLN